MGRFPRPIFFCLLFRLAEQSGARNCGKSHLLSAVPVFLASDRGLFIFPSDEKRICLG
jgi:hypothetical protein